MLPLRNFPSKLLPTLLYFPFIPQSVFTIWPASVAHVEFVCFFPRSFFHCSASLFLYPVPLNLSCHSSNPAEHFHQYSLPPPHLCLNSLHSGNGRSGRCWSWRDSGVENTQVRFMAYWLCSHWASYLSLSLPFLLYEDKNTGRDVLGTHDLVHIKCRVYSNCSANNLPLHPPFSSSQETQNNNEHMPQVCSSSQTLLPFSVYSPSLCFGMLPVFSITSSPSHIPAYWGCLWACVHVHV